MGTDAPDVEEENVIARPSVGYDDMWAKTLLETTELEVVIWASSGFLFYYEYFFLISKKSPHSPTIFLF